MTQLAPAFDGANPQDVQPSTEPVESTEQEVVTSEEEGEQSEEEPGKKPEFKPSSPKTVPIERFNEIYGQMRRLDRLAMQLLEERKTQPATPRREPEVDPDYDSMTPKQLVEYIRKSNRRDLEEVLSQTLVPMQERDKARIASDSLSKAAAKYPDYWEHREPMIEMAEKHPELDAEEVYLLVAGKKGIAGDKIMTRVKEKVEQKKSALTTRRSSPASKTTTPQGFKTVREGALAAAKELGFDVE